jgi:hypothetical protein
MTVATATNRYTAQLRAHERHSRGQITAAHARMKKAVAPTFAWLLKALKDAQESERELGLWWLFEHSRLQTVHATVTQAVGTFAASVSSIIQAGRKQAISIGHAAAQSQLGKRIKQAVMKVPTPASVAALAGTLVNRFTGWVADTATRVRDALLLAASAGITLVVAENLLDRAIERLLPIAIGTDVTQEYDAFNETLSVWYQANSEYVEAWQWVTAEDERVCPFCESMDGSIHDLSESMESHPRCRCEMEPYFLDTSGSPY